MKLAPAEKRLWLVASVCGILGAGLVVTLFRVPRSPLPKEMATPFHAFDVTALGFS